MNRSGNRKEPRWITEEILLGIHAQQIERYGGSHGVRDRNALLAAVGRPINRWGYADSTDFAELAAVYFSALAGTESFHDASARTALAAAVVFLRLNGCTFEADPDELYTLTSALPSKQISDFDVAAWLRPRVRVAH